MAQKYWIGHPPFGYRKRDDGWIEKRPKYESLIKDMFAKIIEFEDYGKTLDYLKKKYGDMVDHLAAVDLEAILRNPVYMGKVPSGEFIELENELEFFVFKEWELNADENFGPGKLAIERHIETGELRPEKKEKLLSQLHEVDRKRLFHLFRIGEAV